MDDEADSGSAAIIGTGTVLTFHYTVRDEDSQHALETSAGGDPLTILFGQPGLLRPVQQALRGRSTGERVTVTVPPEQAFGPRRDDALKRVSKKYFGKPKSLRPGLRATLQTDSGPQTVTIVKVGGKVVDVDTNHPYSGLTVTFVIDVLSVRPASNEEIAHGHAHGPGGHRH
ncbi:MAG: FKBP-type peptidyl-prolyl cis-trans isomerase [Pseudomonadales bacterium]